MPLRKVNTNSVSKAQTCIYLPYLQGNCDERKKALEVKDTTENFQTEFCPQIPTKAFLVKQTNKQTESKTVQKEKTQQR